MATTSGSDLILSLLGAHAGVAVPVGLLAAGAIGTTLISSFLAMSHFAADVFCTVLGFCSLRWMRAARILTIALPCGLACAGPGLYLPLLAFSGAYPTTILYGLAPPLAVLVLRRTTGAAHTADEDDVPSLLPGGPLARLSVTAVASALLCASSALNVRRLLRLAV